MRVRALRIEKMCHTSPSARCAAEEGNYQHRHYRRLIFLPMARTISTYLRTHRKRWTLSQDELAFLIGTKDRTLISRYESGERTPTKRELLACEIIFGTPCSELFPRYRRSIEETVARRTVAFLAKLERRKSEAAGVKRRLARDIMKRMGNDAAA